MTQIKVFLQSRMQPLITVAGINFQCISIYRGSTYTSILHNRRQVIKKEEIISIIAINLGRGKDVKESGMSRMWFI